MMSLDWNREHNPVLSMTSYEEFKAQDETAAKLGGVSKIKTAIPANLFGELLNGFLGSSELIFSTGRPALWCQAGCWEVLYLKLNC